ncbi:MAG: hypothetical protein AAGA02_00150 [Bacteroidota bacterium]
MIRGIHHKSLEGEGKTQLRLLKRTFIPVSLKINKAGQYQTFKVKIPHGSRKVCGVIVTHNAPDQVMHHNRIYLGSAPNVSITRELIMGLNQEFYRDVNRQCFDVSVRYGEKLYFALPKRLGDYFYLTINSHINEFSNPKVVNMRDQWTDFKEDYWVWESIADEWEEVEVCLIKDLGDGGGSDEDDEEEDD